MNKNQALTLAIKAMQVERHKHAPEAAVYQLYGVRTPEHIRAYQNYERLNAAIELLKQEIGRK